MNTAIIINHPCEITNQNRKILIYIIAYHAPFFFLNAIVFWNCNKKSEIDHFKKAIVIPKNDQFHLFEQQL